MCAQITMGRTMLRDDQTKVWVAARNVLNRQSGVPDSSSSARDQPYESARRDSPRSMMYIQASVYHDTFCSFYISVFAGSIAPIGIYYIQPVCDDDDDDNDKSSNNSRKRAQHLVVYASIILSCRMS